MSIRSPLQTQTSQSPLQIGLLQRKCTQCNEKDKLLQRRSANQAEPSEVPPIVHEVLRSPGQPLDSNIRAFMEPHFGHDFSQVRVHTDAEAAESARAVNALAYTVGKNIFFGTSQYSPQTRQGNQLLAHELTHVVQQQGSPSSTMAPISARAEHEAETVSASITEPLSTSQPLTISRQNRGLYRQPAGASVTPTSTPTSMTRAEFEATMRRRFGVTQIRTGTQQEQESRLTPQGGAPSGGISIPNWQSWNPGSDSSVYQSIIQGFEDFNWAINGVPLVSEILFFEKHYELNQMNVPIANSLVGASFGAGQLTIYRSLTTLNAALPISRSTTQGRYPSVTIGISSPGSSPGAPLPLPSRDESIRRLIGHELGHGLTEAALGGANPTLAVDPTMVDDYRREVGWTPGNSPQLFDVGVVAVATALTGNTPPPPTYEITPNTWNSPQWVEQPLSHYSVAGGPTEDFAEAVMTFIHEPNLLLNRSPHRFHFLYSRKARWLPRLLQIPQIGDFPAPRRDRFVV